MFSYLTGVLCLASRPLQHGEKLSAELFEPLGTGPLDDPPLYFLQP